jgi:hypothetical protein
MSGIGLLKQIISSSNLIQPSSYRYYLGAASTAQASADFFTHFDFSNRAIHTIPGFQHAIAKLSTGFLAGYNGSLKFKADIIPELVTVGLAILDALWGYDASAIRLGTVGDIINLIIKIDQFINFTATGSLFLGPPGPGIAFAAIPIPIILIVVAIAVISLIIKLFTPTKVIIEEPSLTWKFRYADTPYLNNGTRIYKNTTLTLFNYEYYCDGIYFYNQSSSATISNKELSYSNNALLSIDPLKLGLAYSSPADQPDSGSIITDLAKLIALPYCSGKPDTITGTNKSLAQTVTFTPQNVGGDLLIHPSTVTVTIPEGTIITTGSQASANSQALSYLYDLTASYAASGSYGVPITGSGGFGAYFTHEIKVETYANSSSYFFDNTNGNGLTVGKYLYYDQGGFLKTFNGYYAVTPGTYSSASIYRTFYKTINGAVTDILTMASAGATTVTSTVNSATYPIQTSNQGYTSDWYWYNVSYTNLNDEVSSIINLNTNPNSLYTTSSLKAGFANYTTSSFYTYDSTSSTASYSEAASGFYYAFNSYEGPYSFAYNTAATISINLNEVCFTDYSTGNPYGINISGATGSASSSLYYPVYMTLKAYNGGSLLATFAASASAEGVTYVPFPSPITKDSNVTNVTIDSFSSPNPNNKISYVAGSFINCNNPTPTPTATPTNTPTNTPTQTPTGTPTNTPTNTPTVTPSNSNTATNTPTQTPTNTPTSTPYQSTVKYDENYSVLCGGGGISITVSWQPARVLCSANSGDVISSVGFISMLRNTIYYISDGTSYIQILTPGVLNNTATVQSVGCTTCPAPTATVTPTATPTTTPTQTPTRTPTNTPTNTPATATFTGCVSSVSLEDACGCGDYGSNSITILGTNITDATKITAISPGVIWADVGPNANIYIEQKVGAIFYVRHFKRDGSANTATPQSGAVNCTTVVPTATNTPTSTPTQTPTQTPTATPTQTPTQTPTATPTSSNTATNTPTNTPTSSNTATNTPTQTPTNTPTNSNTATNTPTNTPTATPTVTPYQSTVKYDESFSTLCGGGGISITVSWQSTRVLCSANSGDVISSVGFLSMLRNTIYYLSDGTNYIQILTPGYTSNTATVQSVGCTTCPAPTATVTPTSTPTSTPSGPAYNFYYMNRYICSSGCSYVENILVATTTSITNTNRYYIDSTGDIFKRTSDGSYDTAYILGVVTSSLNCTSLCGV